LTNRALRQQFTSCTKNGSTNGIFRHDTVALARTTMSMKHTRRHLVNVIRTIGFNVPMKA